jgi:hypothetical protein
MSAQHTPALPDATVISWDIDERTLTDGSKTYDVIGTSDECRVTFYCVDERAAEALVAALNSDGVNGAIAERLR